MVKVQAPALSLDASGSLAGALVFSKWKGRNYVRTLVKPSNPQTGGQVGVRAAFKFLSQNWQNISAGNQATWEDLAEQDVVAEFNAYMKANLLRNRNFLGPSQAYPPALSDTPEAITAFTATAGVRQITVQVDDADTTSANWGVMIYRSTSTGFTPAFDNLVAMVPRNASGEAVFVDTPLDPDTYYYDTKVFTPEAVLGALEGEINATVT